MSKIYDRNAKLEDIQRTDFLPPYKVLSMVGLGKGQNVADVSAGNGYFAIPISEMIGEKNFVYAIDTQIEMIDIIDKKKVQNGIRNLRTVVSEENDLKIDDISVDFTFVALLLNEVKDRKKFLEELKRITLENGKIVILEWQNKEGAFGPPAEQRLDSTLIINELKECGLDIITEVNINDDIIAIIADNK